MRQENTSFQLSASIKGFIQKMIVFSDAEFFSEEYRKRQLETRQDKPLLDGSAVLFV